MTPGPSQLPEEAYAVALAADPRFGPAALRRLLASTPPSVAWSRATRTRRSGGGKDGLGGTGGVHRVGDVEVIEDVEGVARLWQHHEDHGIGVVLNGDPAYPRRLTRDPDAPAVLFYQGDPSVLNRHPTVALVGTRSPTRYGIGVAAQFGAELASHGVSVVSGLALGIDGAAHEGACTAGAPPLGVVAGGLDDPYPRRHARLWARVAEQGAVVSESPAGVPTQKWRFPVRNRLLAALSDAVVVIESRSGGGSLHTVHAANDRGIPVGAVPGSIRSPTSIGTNGLLRDGCFPVCDVTDIMVALSLNGTETPKPASRSATNSAKAYEGPDQAILEELSADPSSLEQLVLRTGLSLPQLCGSLERLASAGVARDLGGWWERT